MRAFEFLTEVKRDTHCSSKCCGANVLAKDCGCASDCAHCNCNAKLNEADVINFPNPTMKQADTILKSIGMTNGLNYLINKPFDIKMYELLIDTYMNRVKGTKYDNTLKIVISNYEQRGIKAKELPPRSPTPRTPGTVTPLRGDPKLDEAPIMRPAGSYDPDPNDVYYTATNNTRPKYEIDYEKDYGPGKSLGRIPNIQSQTEVIQMPDGDVFLFYVKVLPPKPISMRSLRQQIKGWMLKNQTGPTKESNVLGFLKLKPYEDGYRVAGVGMDKSIQGQGKAIKLYLAFTAWKDVPIYSDYTQTPSAKRMWKSILGRYPNRVVAYDQKSKKEIPIDDIDAMYQDEPEGFSDLRPVDAQKVLGSAILFKLLP